MPIDGDFSDIAPIRILSFDIECAAKVGFPIPKRYEFVYCQWL